MDFIFNFWIYIKVCFWFSYFQVVVDVIPKAPQAMLSVSWDKACIRAHLGNIVTPTQMRYEPCVNWPTENNAYYTLMLMDPDAPTRYNATARNFLHWLAVNIPGAQVAKGEIVAAYIGSGAPKGTGLHRYTFLAFKQPKFQSFCLPYISNHTVAGRPFFNATSFTKEYSLELVAGNFVQAEWDEYVPILTQQLGG